MPLPAIIVLAVVAALVAALALALWLGRHADSRFAPLRASATEASDRSTDLAAEFFEWLRTGR
jgi:hypothetical protein